jgi:hypothetical protein
MNTTASYNTGIGSNALNQNTTGANNTSVGYTSLKSNTTGAKNVAVGEAALYYNTTGFHNTAVGKAASVTNTAGADITAIGFEALQNGIGDGNTAVGSQAAKAMTSGSSNTCLGNSSGNYLTPITTGNHNTMIGSLTHVSTGGALGQFCLGYAIQCIGNYYFAFGNSSTNRVYNQYNSNASWTRSSDERLKKDIQDNTDCGLDFINDLRTTTFRWRAPSEITEGVEGHDINITTPSHGNKMYGFIAQEVKTSLDKFNITDFNGWHETPEDQGSIQGISYEMFVMPLVKAVQELSVEVEALKAQLNS